MFHSAFSPYHSQNSKNEKIISFICSKCFDDLLSINSKVLTMTYKAHCLQIHFLSPTLPCYHPGLILYSPHCNSKVLSFSCLPLSQRCIIYCSLLWSILLLDSFLSVETSLNLYSHRHVKINIHSL